tara:strand:- start:2 stop:574 length:573 start_codon:yes stop_codon:yes gene_type:complete
MDQAIVKFIDDVYGYGNLCKLVESDGLEHRDSVLNAIQGTILGTFRRKVEWPNDGRYRRSNNKTIVWPGIATIRDTDDPSAKYERDDLPYHIANNSFFENMGRQNVEDFLIKQVRDLFPDLEVKLERGKREDQRWEYTVNGDNFGLCVRGDVAVGSKALLVDFDASPDYVEGIRDAVRRYSRMKFKLRRG